MYCETFRMHLKRTGRIMTNKKILIVTVSFLVCGPVKSAQEKTTIGSKAQAIAGSDKVDNRLEIAGQ
jgi:hypothetical protein